MKHAYPFSFTILVTFYMACLITANITACKLLIFGSFVSPAGLVVFPLVYILNDIITELYDLKTSRDILIISIVINLFVIGILQLVMVLPYPPFWENQTDYETIFQNTPRILLASIIGSFGGSYSNAWVMDFMKKKVKKYLWLRIFLSTVVGEFLDSIFFIGIAFALIYAFSEIIVLIFFQSAFKILFEVVLSPITCKIISWLKVRRVNFV